MKRISGMSLPLVLALSLSLATNAHGGEPDGSAWSWFSWCHHPECPTCPDDYCPKQLPPCPPWVTSHTPDDYCLKKLPCIAPVKCFGDDDYTRGPWRECLPVCAPAWYMCGPRACAGAEPVESK